MSAGATIEATFCFVDIAGYTALTDSRGAQAAADLVDELDALVQASIKSSVQLQSMTGDCAFRVFPEPTQPRSGLPAAIK